MAVRGPVGATGVGAPAGDAPWMWTAGVVPAWRAPAAIMDLVALDDQRALALMAGGHVAVIDLASGAVTQAPGGTDAGRALKLVRAGQRIIAYGVRGTAAAAWSIEPASLAIAPLPLSEPAAGVDTTGRVAITASPDGAQVLTCSGDRWPTLRDAGTLAAVRVFTGLAGCDRPRFVDAGHVQLERAERDGPAQIVDLATGATTAVAAGAAVVVPGPGGRTATNKGRAVTVRGADGAQASYQTVFSNPIWLGDGSAVVATAHGRVTVLAAAPGQALRTVELPAPVAALAPIPGTPRLVFQLGRHRLGVIDSTTGAVTTAAGANLGGVAKIAALDGAVVSTADRLRVWRRGQLATTSAAGVVEALDVDAGRPAVFATLDGVYRADLRSGASEAIDADATSTAIDRQGPRLAWDRDDRVMVQVDDQPPTAWLRRSDDYFVLDLDLATGRVAMNDDDAFYVARPDQRELFGFHAFDCEEPLYLWLERGRERAVSYDGVTVHLYDTAARRGLGGLELVDDNIEAVAFIPGRDALALVGEALYLWDPVAATVVAWPLPADVAGFGATAVGLDPTGAQVAVGFADGAVLWARLDQVQARAAPVGADVATQHSAAAIRCGKPMVTTFVGVLAPDDDDDDDDDE